MRKRRIAAITTATGLITSLAVTWFVGSALTASTTSIVPSPPPPARNVLINSEPGIRIMTSFWPQDDARAPVVILVHGNGGNRSNHYATANWLHGEGYAVQAIDLRGHGASTATGKSFGWFESRDVHRAMAIMREARPQARIGVIGYSLGGAAAVLGPDGPVDADALVLMSVYPDIRRAIGNRISIRAGRPPATFIEPLLSYQSWSRIGVGPETLSPMNALRRVRSPLLIAGGSEDTYTPPQELPEMQAAADDGTELWLLEGLGHGEVVITDNAAWRARLLTFLDRNLRQP
jgi:uncharacterized protein